MLHLLCSCNVAGTMYSPCWWMGQEKVPGMMTAPVHHCSEAAVLQASAALPGTLGCIELGCPQILLGAVWIGASCMDWVLYGWEVSKCSCVPYGLEVSRLKLVGRYELHETSPAFLCGTCEVGADPTSVSSGAVFISVHGILKTSWRFHPMPGTRDVHHPSH